VRLTDDLQRFIARVQRRLHVLSGGRPGRC
jgi:hypothetical protein